MDQPEPGGVHVNDYGILTKEGGAMRNIGLPELLVILLVAVVLFGGKKIPELAKGLGEGIKNFKNAIKDDQHSDEKKQS